MSSNALLAALLVASATASAQTPAPPSGSPAPAQENAAPATPEGADSAEERIRQEVEKRVEAAKQEMREEIRAQLATQSLATDWQEEWVEEKRKLEVFTLDGYYRMRPNLYYQFSLGKPAGPGRLFPSPRPTEKTQSFADMRLRLEPTFNISEEVRVKLQLDALDNVILGSNPVSDVDRYFYLFDVFNDGQVSPRSAINSFKDSLMLREAYGEVSTPVGLLRFGRMTAHWGLGLLRNDGNCLECDFGDVVDRVMFVTEPFDGFYVTPMFEFNSEGLTTYPNGEQGQPVDISNADDSHSWVLAVARRDTPQQVKAKLDNNQGILNYGLHFSWRTQRYSVARTSEGELDPEGGFVPRGANLYIPDVWLRYEERNFRLEFELAAYLGQITGLAQTAGQVGTAGFNQTLDVLSFGGAAVGEYRLLNGQLNLQLEVGFASGDRAPGFGAYPGEPLGTGTNGATEPGNVEGPQFACGTGGCRDSAIRNFRFNRAYRVDSILWRELVGSVTDAVYVKPTIRYTLTQGFDLFGSAIYSQAIYAESTPSSTERMLGIETNLGARYETEDGFVARVDWSVLFPLGGLNESTAATRVELATAHAIRGTLGIRF
ncbi:MAG TPA: TIGR04551 family protein [Archangium sp.]|uniref:TIGR04551 family protein n=1 Tax=Archangium sp. TaxID=1872627 RepID=UPI002E355EFA|nr:TIGR04551 family protein [Archangium sp.]HEX5746067.1 TIGR04551 family protein [Archangium sp.]